MIKIALSGNARSGKNTVADMIIKKMHIPIDKVMTAALADPIKDIAQIMFPTAIKKCFFGPSELRSVQIPGNFKDKNGNPLTHRQVLLDLGAFGRQYDNDFWLSMLINNINSNLNKELYITTDCRFINEFKYLQSNGFKTIRIIRDEVAKIDDISETEQKLIPNSEFDYIIYNNWTLGRLSVDVDDIILKLKIA